MAHFRGGDRPFSSIHKVLKMLLSPHSSTKAASQDTTTTDMPEDVDEPPDNRFYPSAPIHSDDDNAVVYVKSQTAAAASEQKESLLTRALRSKHEFSPSEPQPSAYDHPFSYRSYPHSNVSGVSTAELTSDGGMTTSPSLSNTPSPPTASHLASRPAPVAPTNKGNAGPGESSVEANLGRKRCISFACGRNTEDQQKPLSQQPSQTSSPKPLAKDSAAPTTPAEPVKRKTMLTFACPGRDSKEPLRERSPARRTALRSRPRGSPAPLARKASPPESKSSAPIEVPSQTEEKKNERIGVPTKGLGKFEESEETRFHEFASSVEEDDEWVKKTAEYPEKITMNDCMKKELAIRKLGEEAENEALEDEEDEDDDDDDDEDEDDSEDDDDLSTVHDSDDGNESDNEAGFADSDESDGGSDYEFWAPSSTAAASSSQPVEFTGRPFEVGSYNSYETHLEPRTPSENRSRRSSKTSKAIKMRPGTPNLPDSTDFVCGTLDEDRPLEVAYKSCMEQRRLSKQVVIPQDIDPSFPTSDPEDEDDDDEEDGVDESVAEEGRGRTGSIQLRRPSPRPSPPKQRFVSPPPPRAGRTSPKRLRSPPPPAMKMKSSPVVKKEDSDETPAMHPHGLNISGLVQRPSMMRTKSLPRTPNPFFANLERLPRWSGNHISDPSDRESSRTREVHNRGPIDIVEGLEKKRQKRKEKFWRQHCRKAAKEQMERRPIPGRGAERMKELGLEVAERCRAYGVGEDAQLVLSV